MTLLAIREWLKKAWAWLKKHWYVPAVLAYTVVLAVIFRRDSKSIEQVLETTRAAYKKEIEALESGNKREREKHQQIIEQYESVLIQLREKYELEKKNLDKKEKKRVKEYTKMYYTEPGELKAILEEKYGLTYVDPIEELDNIVNGE